MNEEELSEIKERLLPYLKKAADSQRLDMVYFMLTNIVKESTELLCYGKRAKEQVIEAFDLPEDTEELALNLNGKKRKIRKLDFEAAMKSSNMDEKAIANIFKKFKRTIPLWDDMIDKSFLSNEIKAKYKTIIAEKSKIIFEL